MQCRSYIQCHLKKLVCCIYLPFLELNETWFMSDCVIEVAIVVGHRSEITAPLSGYDWGEGYFQRVKYSYQWLGDSASKIRHGLESMPVTDNN
jgi:hypothetical protein